MRLFVVGLVILAAGAAPSSSGAGGPVCRASAVHYRTVPAPRGVGGPWVASTNAAFRGYLFYWGATRWARSRARNVRIFTAKARVGVHPKVLWVALRRSSATLVIRGRRLDGAGSFTARYPATSGGQFPSYVTVPSAGCWRVTVRSGSLQGSVTFAASDSA